MNGDELKNESTLDLKRIEKLMKLVKQHGFTEFEWKSQQESIKFKVQAGGIHIPADALAPPRPHQHVPAHSGGPSADLGEERASATPKADNKPQGKEVHSPFVGTFFRSPAPGEEAYVKEGDRVRVGQALCIIEAMKVLNEIESDVDGVVLAVLPENGEAVEFGQTLFVIQ